ncbi:Venom dipeptidyl peptidase 4 [Blattella germanica]|nr:Venom dipeptidyl peptidase 4 [Blattella germanica]
MTNGDVINYNIGTLSSDVLVYRRILHVPCVPITLEIVLQEEYQATSYELTADGLYLLIGYDQQSVSISHDPLALTFSPFYFFLIFKHCVYRMSQGYRHSTASRFVLYDLTYNSYINVANRELLQLVKLAPVGSGLAYVLDNDIYYMTSANAVETRITFDGEPGVVYNGVPDWVYEEVIVLLLLQPGTPNPAVSLHVVDLTNPNYPVTLSAPVDIVSSDHILFAVTWATANEVAAVWTNRVQNVATTRICNSRTASCQNVHTIMEKSGWVDVVTPIFDANGVSYVTVLPQTQSGGAGNYQQLTLVSRSGQETALTFGRSVVTLIYGWDYINNIIYYQATPEGAPSQRHVYAVAADGSFASRCLSCEMGTLEGRACLYAYGSFSTEMTYLAMTCAGPDPIHVDLYNAMDTSKPLITAQARLWLPPGIDTSGATKYPMLVYVYGGPNSAQISDAFALGWGAYLTTNRSIVYAMIDGRGSGMKGDAIKFSIYRRLGTVEVLDQIGVTMTLRRMYPFLDPARIGIWGWSYGGNQRFFSLKCGASVAPVTSWIYYDAIYTERYMGLPLYDDNLSGYNDSDVTRRAHFFKGKQFYLLHGNADDNVHYLQAMMLSRALERANILFRQQSYPDENHNLRSVLFHVYGSMDQFWEDCFSL